MATHTTPRQLLYAIPLEGHHGESDDYDNLPAVPGQPPNAPVYAAADGDYGEAVQLRNSNKTTANNVRRQTLLSPPTRASDSSSTVRNSAYTGPAGGCAQQNRWNEYASASTLMEPAGMNSEKAVSAMPLSVRPRRDYHRFWLGLNIVTFLIACAALAISLAHMARGEASGKAATGGVEASAVNGLPAWQEEVTRNLTTVQSNFAALLNGLFALC